MTLEPHPVALVICSLDMPYFELFSSVDASQYEVGQSVFGEGKIHSIEQDTVMVESETPIDLDKIKLLDGGALDTEDLTMEVRSYCWIDSLCIVMDR